MKKRINITMDELILAELDKEVQLQSKENGYKLTRSQAIESAVTMWINYHRDMRSGRFVQIGVDEDGMPVFGLRPHNEQKKEEL